MGMVLRSPAFPDFGWIPDRYAAGASFVSPPLVWWDAPSATKSFAIVCDDLDAPDGRFLRWGLCDIPGNKRGIVEAYPATSATTYTYQGPNDFGFVGYYGGDGAKRGVGLRHLRFRLFALGACSLGCAPGASARTILARALGEALEVAQLIGARAPVVANDVGSADVDVAAERPRAPTMESHSRAAPG